MKYLLTSLNHTDSRAKATKNYIQMAFSIDPRDIRYDKNIPSINKKIGSLIQSDRSTLLTERLSKVVSDISESIKSNVTIGGVRESSDGVEVVLNVNEESIKVNV